MASILHIIPLSLLLMAAISSRATANNLELTNTDKNILNLLHKKFRCQFEKERQIKKEQYAVLYYGEPNSIINIDLYYCGLPDANRTIFRTKVAHELNITKHTKKGCLFTAAGSLRISGSDLERMLFSPFSTMVERKQSYTNCPVGPNAGKGDVYLYISRNPCADKEPDLQNKQCVSVIKQFASECGANFRRMVIGYKEALADEQVSSSALSEVGNVVMRKVDYPKVTCPGSSHSQEL